MNGSTTHAVALLDEKRALVGPVTKRIRRRSMAIWCVVAAFGTALAFAGVGPAWAAFGVSLVFPGAGFVYSTHPGLCVLTLLLFVLGLAIWLGVGAFVTPIAVWLGAAVLAAVIVPAHPWSWARFGAPLAVLAVAALRALTARPRLAKQLAVARAANAHLAKTSMRELKQEFEVGPSLNDEDLGAMRFTLDLALQPLERFDGFTTIDQFREGAWRYQLYALTESLAMLRSTRLPAFTGYLEAAQRNAVLKVTDRRVWKYWFWENLWGNGRVNPDPMVRENIMITGWYALALGAYQLTTGDRSIDSDGSLPFRWSKRTVYEYSFPKIATTLVENFNASELCFYPCEPNWVFSYCNEEGMAGLILYDRFHGTNHAEPLLPTFLARMEQEFTGADGAQVVIMANRIGLQLKARSATLFAGSLWLRSVLAPQIAARNWELVRHEYLREDGEELFKLGPLDRVDSGNYRTSDGNGFYPQMMVAAKEIGDFEVYDYAKARHNALGVENTEGRLRWPGSTFANLTSHMGRFGTPGAWNRLAHSDYPQAWRNGPVLSDAPYPEVLVSRAVSDGQALEVELVPGAAGGRFRLGFSRLAPRVSYRLEGGAAQTVTADDSGDASVEVDIDRRLPLQLLPLT